jgi:hypothetical protein
MVKLKRKINWTKGQKTIKQMIIKIELKNEKQILDWMMKLKRKINSTKGPKNNKKKED